MEIIVDGGSFISKTYVFVILLCFGIVLLVGLSIVFYFFRSWLCFCNRFSCCEESFVNTTLPRILSKYPIQKYTPDLNKYKQENFAICLASFKPNIPIRILDCKHIFHGDCIVEWFTAKRNNVCPICNIDPNNAV